LTASVVDTNNIGDREMTQIAKHSFALLVALLITVVSFDAALTVPLAAPGAPYAAPILA
jgi:hypothetical protein